MRASRKGVIAEQGKLKKFFTFNSRKSGQRKPTEAEPKTKVDIIFLTEEPFITMMTDNKSSTILLAANV